MKRFRLLVALLMLVGSAFADNFSARYPSDFNYVGRVNGIDVYNRVMEVNGKTYKLPSGVAVSNQNTKFATIRSIAKGSVVGIDFKMVGKERVAKKVYLLPEHFLSREP